jgi:hypothetical protein
MQDESKQEARQAAESAHNKQQRVRTTSSRECAQQAAESAHNKQQRVRATSSRECAQQAAESARNKLTCPACSHRDGRSFVLDLLTDPPRASIFHCNGSYS